MSLEKTENGNAPKRYRRPISEGRSYDGARREKSCGAVVFTREGGETRYVIVGNLSGRSHGFPKGHVEPGETERETAIREIGEETALEVRFVGDFREEETYELIDGAVKTVVYFLAEYEGQTPTARRGEIASIDVVPLDEAAKLLEHESTRRVLLAADGYLKSSGK